MVPEKQIYPLDSALFGDVSVVISPVDDRRPSAGRCRARRRLFGPVDHNEIQHMIKTMMDAHLEEKKARWNFDFENGRPLPDSAMESSIMTPPASPVSKIATEVEAKKSGKTKQITMDGFLVNRRLSGSSPLDKRKSSDSPSNSQTPQPRKLLKSTAVRKL